VIGQHSNIINLLGVCSQATHNFYIHPCSVYKAKVSTVDIKSFQLKVKVKNYIIGNLQYPFIFTFPVSSGPLDIKVGRF
jgi:hypothetical protein